MTFPLRPYQSRAVEQLREHVRAGRRKVILCAPTGAGKSVCSAAIIESAVSKGSRVIVVAHRLELITQLSQHLDRVGVPHGIIQADNPRWRPWEKTQVVSIQTVMRRLGNRPLADLIVVDEAHRSAADSYGKLFSAYPDASVIGLTATPVRSDGRCLGDLYDALVKVADPQELVDQGFLMAPRIWAPEHINTAKFHTRAGDWAIEDLEKAMNQKRIAGSVTKHWLKHAAGLRTIVFAVSVKHSQDLCAAFVEAGVRAEHVDGETPAEQRAAALAQLEKQEVDVLTNCGLYGEGLDIPSLGAVVLARPTKSVVVHLQQIGRVLRTFPGKAQPIVLDHAGNTLRLGHPLEAREWNLNDVAEKENGKPKNEQRGRVCPSCFAVIAPQCKICPECGQPLAANTPQIIETEDELREFGVSVCRACGSTDLRPVKNAEKFGEHRALIICGQCGDKQWATSKQVKKATPEQKQREFERLRKVAKDKGFQDGWAWHQYRAVYGTWPSRYA